MLVSESPKSKRLSQATLNHYKAHARSWESSGLSQAVYCQNQGLNYHTFSYVRSRYLHSKKVNSTNKPTQAFIAVQPKHSIVRSKASQNLAVKRDDKIILRLPSGCILELPVGLDQSQWISLFNALGINS